MGKNRDKTSQPKAGRGYCNRCDKAYSNPFMACPYCGLKDDTIYRLKPRGKTPSMIDEDWGNEQ